MEQESPIAEAIRLAGGAAVMARALGESVQTVSNWKARGEPPANRVLAIERMSGVSRRRLRTDWAEYWPDQTSAPPVPAGQEAA